MKKHEVVDLALTENLYIDPTGEDLSFVVFFREVYEQTKGDASYSSRKKPNALFRSMRTRGLFKGTYEEPEVAWRLQKILDLSKKYPYLDFFMDGHGNVTAKGRQLNGTLRLKNCASFEQRVRKMVASMEILLHPAFFRVLSSSERGVLAKHLVEAQVQLDSLFAEGVEKT